MSAVAIGRDGSAPEVLLASLKEIEVSTADAKQCEEILRTDARIGGLSALARQAVDVRLAAVTQ